MIAYPDAEPVATANAPLRLHSAIYRGRVRHHRYAPRAHAFTLPLFMLYLDLDELDQVFPGSHLWRVEAKALASFHRRDYFGDPRQPLADAVRDAVGNHCGRRPNGPVRMLTHPRYCGYCFNPVTFYYCFAPDGTTLVAIVAHITNTPWGERHAYVLPCAEHFSEPHKGTHRFAFGKQFHVSPFMGMAQDYAWAFNAPGDRLGVHMENHEDGALLFTADLTLIRQPATAANLARAITLQPLMTVQVIANIHIQAARLWWKGVPSFTRPQPHSQPDAQPPPQPHHASMTLFNGIHPHHAARPAAQATAGEKSLS
jgi:DUF1365 family protein